MENQVQPKKVIIDTDGGVDDALAILLALNSPQEISIQAITTVAGNVPVKQATENVLRILEANQLFHQQRNWKDDGKGSVPSSSFFPPVFEGESKPLKRELTTATHVHGYDGLGGITQLKIKDKEELKYPLPRIAHDSSKSAVDAILEIVSSNPKEVTIITIGPMTNVAVAIQRDKEKMKLVKEIVIMGGAFEHYGNITLSAEYNIYVDPESVQTVLELGIPNITFVPLDVTEQVWYNDTLLEPFLNTSMTAVFISDLIQTVLLFKDRVSKEKGLHMHDPLAIVAAMDQSVIDVFPDTMRKEAFVVVECDGKYTSGKTIADLRETPRTTLVNAKVCVAVKAPNFYRLWNERVLRV